MVYKFVTTVDSVDTRLSFNSTRGDRRCTYIESTAASVLQNNLQLIEIRRYIKKKKKGFIEIKSFIIKI